jgi:hypothetical protein
LRTTRGQWLAEKKIRKIKMHYNLIEIGLGAREQRKMERELREKTTDHPGAKLGPLLPKSTT